MTTPTVVSPKPCPHCGGTATFTHLENMDDGRYVGMTLRCCGTLASTIAYPVYLGMNVMQQERMLREDLIEKWNKRFDDDPECDGTDAAHPAFWRGNEYATQVMVGLIENILDGKDTGIGKANEPWETARRRMIAMVDKVKVKEVSQDVAEGNARMADNYIALTCASPHLKFDGEAVQLEMNDDLRDILGRPNFTCRDFANLLRATGTHIEPKAEHEQAAVILFALNMYLKHGTEKWEDEFESEVKRLIGIAKEKQGEKKDS